MSSVKPNLRRLDLDLFPQVSYPPEASYISSYLSIVPSSFRPALSRFGRFDITAAPFPNSYNFRGGRRSTFDDQ